MITQVSNLDDPHQRAALAKAGPVSVYSSMGTAVHPPAEVLLAQAVWELGERLDKVERRLSKLENRGDGRDA